MDGRALTARCRVMDPTEKMVEIIMMQGANGPLQRDFENAVRQAMIDIASAVDVRRPFQGRQPEVQ